MRCQLGAPAECATMRYGRRAGLPPGLPPPRHTERNATRRDINIERCAMVPWAPVPDRGRWGKTAGARRHWFKCNPNFTIQTRFGPNFPLTRNTERLTHSSGHAAPPTPACKGAPTAPRDFARCDAGARCLKSFQPLGPGPRRRAPRSGWPGPRREAAGALRPCRQPQGGYPMPTLW